MLDDGQAQAGAADLLRVALIHPVEPLEDPVGLPRRDADAGVLDGENHPLGLPGDRNLHPAPFLIIFNGVVAEIEEDFLQKLLRSVHPLAGAGEGEGDLPLPGGFLSVRRGGFPG